MASATVLPLHYAGHGDKISADLRHEDLCVTVAAGHPLGMTLMSEKHVRQGGGILHYDIKINGGHVFLAGDAGSRLDLPELQGCHPVYIAAMVKRELLKCFGRFL